MKKTFASNPSVFVIAVLILALIGSIVLAHWLPSLEMATTLLAALLSVGCLVHIYQEHHAWNTREERLCRQLIEHVYHEYAHLPQVAPIADHLASILANQSSPECRLETLKRLQSDQTCQLAFVQEIQAKALEQDVLETLGLCWQKPSNEKNYSIRA